MVVFLFSLSAILFLSLFGITGTAGTYVVYALEMVFGWGKWLFPVILIGFGYMVTRGREGKSLRYLGMFLLVLSYSGLMHLAFGESDLKTVVVYGEGGGFLGWCIGYPLYQMLGIWGALVVLIASSVVSVLISFETAVFVPLSFFKKFFSRAPGEEPAYGALEKEKKGLAEEPVYKSRKPRFFKKKEAVFEEENLEEGSPEREAEDAPACKEASSESYQPLPLNLLSDSRTKPTSGDTRVGQVVIRKALENFGIPVEMGEISVGPTVTQYTLKPSEGIKLSRITALSNDLAMALAAHPIRIEAPIPGKSLVGIEVPNQSVASVSLREVLESEEFKGRKSSLSIALGKDVAGKAWVADLSRMPHMLVAGATGSGKTVCLNSIIVSLLYQNTPRDLKMIMVDPKRVELTSYNGIPHLITPVVTDVKKTINALRWSVAEMDRRFELLSRAGKRDIGSYNKGKDRDSGDRMPYLVVVIDELADLMASAGAEVEALVVRLAQMARAVGIHLVMATQRPSVDVITGLIKANITSRCAFSVASSTDSRTILDFSGAEKLLGRGDMLFIAPWISKPKRLQGVFVSAKEIEAVTNFLKESAEPDYVEEVVESRSSSVLPGFEGDGEGDELLPDAKDVILRAGRASASLLQRRLRVGYARAARILDLLEEEGFIGPVNGAKPREILKRPQEDHRQGGNEFGEDRDWEEG